MKEILLTQNIIALVDDKDYDLVSQYKWYAAWNGYTWYAATGRDPTIFMHNLIMGRKGVDHANRKGWDNRRSNLRFATHAQNNANSIKQSGTMSQYKGVTMQGPRYRAQIQHQGKNYHLGYFDVEEDAARAYDVKALEFFGEYARINFPNK